MGMRTVNGTWGGGGAVFETITLSPKVTFYSFRIASATLSCCPSTWGINIVAEQGSLVYSANLGGSTTTHYIERVAGLSSSTLRRGTSAIELKQLSSGCTGEPFQLKVCMTVTDWINCSTANIAAKSCNAAASYVDVT